MPPHVRQRLAPHDAHFWVSQLWQPATRTPSDTLQGVAAQAGTAVAPLVAIVGRLLRRQRLAPHDALLGVAALALSHADAL